MCPRGGRHWVTLVKLLPTTMLASHSGILFGKTAVLSPICFPAGQSVKAVEGS